jgi:polysaccharide biosynthesis protein PslH
MGGQKGIALFYKYFSALNPMHIISTKNNDDANESNIKQHKILSNGKVKYINILLYFTIKRFIKKHQITHVIIEHPYYGWLAFLLRKKSPIKLIVHSHNIEALRFKSTGKWWWRILYYYEKFTHRIADFNFFIHDDDKEYAIKHFKLFLNQCTTITYGFDLQKSITIQEHERAKQQLIETYSLQPNSTLMLFNGTLNYEPNVRALEVILHNINPLLKQKTTTPYYIIICGKNLPESYDGLQEFKNVHIIYAGFVNDISLYFKGCDIFLNPVIDGGGIKTKLVEALGYGMNVVTTKDGAIGVHPSICGGKLSMAENNWEQFTNEILSFMNKPFIPTPDGYYEHFYWGNIAAKATQHLLTL